MRRSGALVPKQEPPLFSVWPSTEFFAVSNHIQEIWYLDGFAAVMLAQLSVCKKPVGRALRLAGGQLGRASRFQEDAITAAMAMRMSRKMA